MDIMSGCDQKENGSLSEGNMETRVRELVESLVLINPITRFKVKLFFQSCSADKA